MDLSTTYMGLKLKNPIVPSASPLTQHIDSVKALEDAGAAAVVCHSLFEEQITHESGELDHYLSYGTESYAEATTYFPEPEDFKLGPVEYLDHIADLKKAGINYPFYKNFEKLFAAEFPKTGPGELVVICGSIYGGGEALKYFLLNRKKYHGLFRPEFSSYLDRTALTPGRELI